MAFFSQRHLQHSHLRFMRNTDDKAYIRPGTSESLEKTRNTRILTLSDVNKARENVRLAGTFGIHQSRISQDFYEEKCNRRSRRRYSLLHDQGGGIQEVFITNEDLPENIWW